MGLTYSLAVASAGITYQTFNEWMNKGINSTSGEYFEYYKHITKCDAEGALKCLKRLNEADNAENCQVCMWILERWFPGAYGRCEYRKINANSANKNENVKIRIMNTDGIRNKILEKLSMGRESHKSLID